MKKIVRISRLLKISALSLCFALPLFEAGYWITGGYPFLAPYFARSKMVWSNDLTTVTWDNLNDLQRFLGFIICMIPLVFSMLALRYLSLVFAAFERKKLFEKANVQILKKAGWALLLGQIAYPILYSPLYSLAMTYRNAVGHRQIMVTVQYSQFQVVAIALSILLLSWIFQEAATMREEQETTI